MSAEYIMAGGNENVILCERGIRTFETYTRNTLRFKYGTSNQKNESPSSSSGSKSCHRKMVDGGTFMQRQP